MLVLDGHMTLDFQLEDVLNVHHLKQALEIFVPCNDLLFEVAWELMQDTQCLFFDLYFRHKVLKVMEGSFKSLSLSYTTHKKTKGRPIWEAIVWVTYKEKEQRWKGDTKD